MLGRKKRPGKGAGALFASLAIGNGNESILTNILTNILTTVGTKTPFQALGIRIALAASSAEGKIAATEIRKSGARHAHIRRAQGRGTYVGNT
jgi:hypothetical protein